MKVHVGDISRIGALFPDILALEVFVRFVFSHLSRKGETRSKTSRHYVCANGRDQDMIREDIDVFSSVLLHHLLF